MNVCTTSRRGRRVSAPGWTCDKMSTNLSNPDPISWSTLRAYFTSGKDNNRNGTCLGRKKSPYRLGGNCLPSRTVIERGQDYASVVSVFLQMGCHRTKDQKVCWGLQLVCYEHWPLDSQKVCGGVHSGGSTRGRDT